MAIPAIGIIPPRYLTWLSRPDGVLVTTDRARFLVPSEAVEDFCPTLVAMIQQALRTSPMRRQLLTRRPRYYVHRVLCAERDPPLTSIDGGPFFDLFEAWEAAALLRNRSLRRGTPRTYIASEMCLQIGCSRLSETA